MYGFKFSLEGDFAHFRDPTTQQVLETFLGPPRSTVVGLIGSAIGQDRAEIEELDKKIKVGIMAKDINGKRKETVNIHNLKGKNFKREPHSHYSFEYLNNNVIAPTLRVSLVHPRYTLGVFSEDAALVREIRDKINKPEYPLYLGISEYLAWVQGITGVKELTPKEDNVFSCFVPGPGEFVSHIKSGYSVKPAVHQTPKRTYTENGERKSEFIDLLMQYNSRVGLDEDRKHFVIEGDKLIAF